MPPCLPAEVTRPVSLTPSCLPAEVKRTAEVLTRGAWIENVTFSVKILKTSMPTRGLHSLLPLSPSSDNSFDSSPQDPFRQLQHLCASVLNRLPGRAHQQQSEQAPEHGGQLQSSAGTVPAVHGHANRLQGMSFSADAQPFHQSPPHDLRSGLHKVTELLHVCLTECTSLLSSKCTFRSEPPARRSWDVPPGRCCTHWLHNFPRHPPTANRGMHSSW